LAAEYPGGSGTWFLVEARVRRHDAYMVEMLTMLPWPRAFIPGPSFWTVSAGQ